MTTSDTHGSVGLYSRPDAQEMAAELADRFWPRPTEDMGFDQAETSALEGAITDLGSTRSVAGDSGLEIRDFTWRVYRLMRLFINESLRPSPETAKVDGHPALRDAFYIMLASPRANPVRQALDQEIALVETRRPKGLDWYSDRRMKRKFEEQAPDVRANYAKLKAACQEFLAA